MHANQLILDHMDEKQFNHPDKIKIGAGSSVGSDVKMIGPVIIGENCILKNCTIGPYVSIGAGSEIVGATIRESILLSGVTIRGDVRLNNSLLGKQVSIVKTSATPPADQRLIVGDKTVIEWV